METNTGTLTDLEVAARLGLSPFTVRAWRRHGTGPKYLKLGRAVRYRPEDVDAWAESVAILPATPQLSADAA